MTPNNTTPTPIRVVALCGSLRTQSTTRFALNIALQGAKAVGAEIQLIDLRTYNLIFCAGKENEDSYPQDVFKLRAEVHQAHGILLGTPEYHGGYSGVLKNALDLMGFNEFQGKVVGLIATAGGQTGAINSLNGLRTVSRSLRAWVVPQQISIPQAWQVFDDTGQTQDHNLTNRLKDVGSEVARFAYLHTSDDAKQFLERWEAAQQNPGGD